jgi:hypothetical protein
VGPPTFCLENSLMIQKLTMIAACAVLGAGSLATALPASAQSAPSSSTTTAFATFLTDVLAGHTPPHISSTLQQQSSQLISGVKQTLGTLGTFHRLEYVREESMQGYRRYHYRAVFEKGTRGLAWITDSNGTVVGFMEDPTSTPAP